MRVILVMLVAQTCYFEETAPHSWMRQVLSAAMILWTASIMAADLSR